MKLKIKIRNAFNLICLEYNVFKEKILFLSIINDKYTFLCTNLFFTKNNTNIREIYFTEKNNGIEIYRYLLFIVI